MDGETSDRLDPGVDDAPHRGFQYLIRQVSLWNPSLAYQLPPRIGFDVLPDARNASARRRLQPRLFFKPFYLNTWKASRLGATLEFTYQYPLNIKRSTQDVH